MPVLLTMASDPSYSRASSSLLEVRHIYDPHNCTRLNLYHNLWNLFADVPQVHVRVKDRSLKAGDSVKIVCTISGARVTSMWQLDKRPLVDKLPRKM